MSEPLSSTCAECGQTDNDPKHVAHVGTQEALVFGELKKFYHDLDADKDGYLEFHFDCPSEFHLPENQAIIDAAKSGTHGNDLRTLITGGAN